MVKIIIGVVVAAIVVISAFLLMDPVLQKNPIDDTSLVSTVEGITVKVEGEVTKTGSYVLKEGSLMSDLIEAAGGVTTNADSLAYFDEAPLSNGMTYFIASKYDVNDICNNKELKKVNINSDDVETLTTITGFSSSVANAVVDYRNTTSMFYTIEGLLEVYGIGNATYQKVRNYVTLHN